MGERHLIVDHLKFSYEGLFNPAELYDIIAGWFFEKGWDWYEKLNQEQITSTGKQVHLILEPWKSVSDYYKLTIHCKINMIDLKEVEVEQKGEKLRLHHGLIRMTFDGYIISDRKSEWSDKPFYWFLSFILEKYFFREHFMKFESWLKSDVDHLYNHIKTYLNVYKFAGKP